MVHSPGKGVSGDKMMKNLVGPDGKIQLEAFSIEEMIEM